MLRRKVAELVKLNRTETSQRNEQVLWNENNFVWSSEVMNLVSSPQNLTLIQRLWMANIFDNNYNFCVNFDFFDHPNAYVRYKST